MIEIFLRMNTVRDKVRIVIALITHQHRYLRSTPRGCSAFFIVFSLAEKQ